MTEDVGFDLSKSDVRGKRSTNGATKKKFSKKLYDEDVQEHERKAAGKKGHSRHYDEDDSGYDPLEYEDEPYGDIDPRLIK